MSVLTLEKTKTFDQKAYNNISCEQCTFLLTLNHRPKLRTTFSLLPLSHLRLSIIMWSLTKGLEAEMVPVYLILVDEAATSQREKQIFIALFFCNHVPRALLSISDGKAPGTRMILLSSMSFTNTVGTRK